MTVSRIGVVVLAAGRSTRFSSGGEHKLLAQVLGVPLIWWSVSAAQDSATGDVVVVTGRDDEAVRASLAGLPVLFVHEPRFGDGMATSLRAGIEAFDGGVDAILVALGDQPEMRPAAYRQVATAWRSSGAPIVVPRYQNDDRPAHPVLFSASVFDEIRALRGDVGARAVVARDPSRVSEARLDWPAPRDVDTRDDLTAVEGEMRRTVAHFDTPHPASQRDLRR